MQVDLGEQLHDPPYPAEVTELGLQSREHVQGGQPGGPVAGGGPRSRAVSTYGSGRSPTARADRVIIDPDGDTGGSSCGPANHEIWELFIAWQRTHPAVVSYYKNSEGNVPTLYAWRILDYWKWTNRPNSDDYQPRP